MMGVCNVGRLGDYFFYSPCAWSLERSTAGFSVREQVYRVLPFSWPKILHKAGVWQVHPPVMPLHSENWLGASLAMVAMCTTEKKAGESVSVAQHVNCISPQNPDDGSWGSQSPEIRTFWEILGLCVIWGGPGANETGHNWYVGQGWKSRCECQIKVGQNLAGGISPESLRFSSSPPFASGELAFSVLFLWESLPFCGISVWF